MSILLGRYIPANSVGVLPDVYAHVDSDGASAGYLASPRGNEMKATASVINAKVWIPLVSRNCRLVTMSSNTGDPGAISSQTWSVTYVLNLRHIHLTRAVSYEGSTRFLLCTISWTPFFVH